MAPTTTNASGQEASNHAGYAGKRINDFILPPSEKIQNENDTNRRFFMCTHKKLYLLPG
jgi:hypothetical protein